MQAQLKIDWNNPKGQLSAFFNVHECTQGDDRRIPTPGSQEEQNILAMALELDAIREAWGSAIGVTSWYRPEEVNAEVGGVSSSQHLNGGAVDIYPLAEGRGQEFEDWLDSCWGGGLGYGQGSGRGFTHIDLRGGGFLHGEGAIRWSY